jgi:hypothetical protein
MSFRSLPIELYYTHILPYVVLPPMKLLDWIDINRLDWNGLSSNINAIDLLKENTEHLDWYFLSKNPAAIELLLANQDKIDWKMLSMNPHKDAIKLLSLNIDKIKCVFIILEMASLIMTVDSSDDEGANLKKN